MPYTVVLLSTFDFIENTVLPSFNSHTFNKHDDYLFIQKFFIRFGAATSSLLLAQAVCYPLDTAKRCLQMNGALAHKQLYDGSLLQCLRELRAS